MKFTEEKLEQAVIELFNVEQIPHCHGETIHKEMSDVLLYDDLKHFLINQYGSDGITTNEIESVVRQLELYPSSDLYGSNKSIMKLIADGFVLKREDRTEKDLYIYLLDFETIENNNFKIVNQLEIQGYEKRIPDGIVYINGLPLVVFEFKSAVKENTTIKDAYTVFFCFKTKYRSKSSQIF